VTSKSASRGEVNGIVLLDKNAGMSSNQALQAVKRLYNARKAGHTGSLDPLATGLLVICLGEATKVSAYLLEVDKYYRTTCRLGVKTSTADADGETIKTRPVQAYSDAQIERVLQMFRGHIAQIPPMYSAVKHEGQRLYKLARLGQEVARVPREILIHELRLVERRSQISWIFDVRCSKGTYVRTLIEDIGETLGCGAHVTELRRLSVAPYEAPDMVNLDAMYQLGSQGRDALMRRLLPIDSALAGWPAVSVDEASAFYLQAGQPVQVAGAPTEGKTRLYDRRHQFIGLGRVLDDGRVAPERTVRVRQRPSP
jgi:tRNA pseudouridine55 synthase